MLKFIYEQQSQKHHDRRDQQEEYQVHLVIANIETAEKAAFLPVQAGTADRAAAPVPRGQRERRALHPVPALRQDRRELCHLHEDP